MTKIIEYVDIPDRKVEAFKDKIAKTRGNGEWMKTHSERIVVETLDAFFVELPTCIQF